MESLARGEPLSLLFPHIRCDYEILGPAVLDYREHPVLPPQVQVHAGARHPRQRLGPQPILQFTVMNSILLL